MLRHNPKYYLKKIQKGEMTSQQVASIMHTTVNNVALAYSNYINRQNPFNRKSFDLQVTIQTVISLVSTLLVLLTLFEMQQERNMAYAPDIVMDSVSAGMIWNERGRLFADVEESVYSLSQWEDEGAYINIQPKIKMCNIGAGVAKNVTIEWDTATDLPQFMKLLNQHDGVETWIEGPHGIVANYALVIKTPRDQQGVGMPYENSRFDFMLGSAQEQKVLEFPLVYYELMRELSIILIEGDDNDTLNLDNIPSIHLLIHYSDIQGKSYNKKIEISINYLLLYGSSGSEGCCVFNLTSTSEIISSPLLHNNILLG